MIRKNRSIPVQDLKLLIFDLDGTLVDSRIDLANSVNAMLRHYCKPELASDVIASYIGNGAPMLVRRSLGDPDDENFVQEALLYFMAYYREHKLDTTYVYAGIKEMLDAVARTRNGASRPSTQGNHAVQMAVLSNKPVIPSQVIVDALGLGGYFFRVYGGNSFHTKKPDPHGLLTLIEEANVLYPNDPPITPPTTVMIGDSAVDVLTARNCGALSIGCTFGLAPHSLEDAPPTLIAQSACDWPTLLGI